MFIFIFLGTPTTASSVAPKNVRNGPQSTLTTTRRRQWRYAGSGVIFFDQLKRRLDHARGERCPDSVTVIFHCLNGVPTGEWRQNGVSVLLQPVSRWHKAKYACNSASATPKRCRNDALTIPKDAKRRLFQPPGMRQNGAPDQCRKHHPRHW